MHSEHERDMRVLVATVSEVMVMFVFITLGANIPWGEIQAEFGPALARRRFIDLPGAPDDGACLPPPRPARIMVARGTRVPGLDA